MGCQSSRIGEYSGLTEKDIQQIPHAFRDVQSRNSSPGMSYWFDTCFVQEGTCPVDISVGLHRYRSFGRERRILLNTHALQSMGTILEN